MLFNKKYIKMIAWILYRYLEDASQCCGIHMGHWKHQIRHYKLQRENTLSSDTTEILLGKK